MFNKITFNSADTSTWPQLLLGGQPFVGFANLTTHAKYGDGLSWPDVQGRELIIYGGGMIVVIDENGNNIGIISEQADEDKKWAEGQIYDFQFTGSKGDLNMVAFNWGEPVVINSTPEEESKEEPKPIEGGGDNPAELEDGEEPNGGPIGEPIVTGPIGGEPTLNPIKGDQGDTYKEEPKEEFEIPTDVEGLANFLQSFNAEIITYNEALNQIESVLIETKEGLKKTEKLDEEFTTRASHVTTKVAAINVRQAEEIAAVELELDAEVTQANELKTAMQVKVTEVESRNQTIQENPVISKLTQNVSGSLRTRHNTLMASMSKVNELMARDVVVEKASDIENAKVEKEVLIKEQLKEGDDAFEPVRVPTMGDFTIKAQP